MANEIICGLSLTLSQFHTHTWCTHTQRRGIARLLPSWFTLPHKTHTAPQLTAIERGLLWNWNNSGALVWGVQFSFCSFSSLCVYSKQCHCVWHKLGEVLAAFSQPVVRFICHTPSCLSLSLYKILMYVKLSVFCYVGTSRCKKKYFFAQRTTLCPSRQKHNRCKRPFVCWCDCLNQSSRWVLFNRNWQQFSRPLLLVLFSPPNAVPTSRLKRSPLLAYTVFLFYLLQSKSISTVHFSVTLEIVYWIIWEFP